MTGTCEQGTVVRKSVFYLAVRFYHSISALKLSADAKDQLNRAARSIALNLAEGSGRKTIKDQKRFYNIAFASLRESQAILVLEKLEDSEQYRILDNLAAHTFKLINHG